VDKQQLDRNEDAEAHGQAVQSAGEGQDSHFTPREHCRRVSIIKKERDNGDKGERPSEKTEEDRNKDSD
jgi:hypothetical protein